MHLLSDVLWRERQLLELLLFKLTEEQLILHHGRSRWLGHATREVETVLTEIREAELARAVHADAAALDLGLPGGSSLTTLAGAASEPWSGLLHAHRDALVSLAAEISAVSEANRELLAMSHRATQETLAGLELSVHGEAGGYGPLGSPATDRAAADRTARLVDRAI